MNVIPGNFNATRSDVGNVGITLNDDGSTYVWVCCSNYGAAQWMPLETLSTRNWRLHRDAIADAICAEKKKDLEIERKSKDSVSRMASVDETQQMLTDLYTKMKAEEKKDFLKSHTNSWLNSITCVACLEHCADKYKCIHRDCYGMCKSCYDKLKSDEGDKKCPACKQEQVSLCCICQEEKEDDDMVEASGGCGHRVCLKCLGLAFMSGHPIDNCPLCRGDFGPNVNRYDSDDDIPDLLEGFVDANMPALEDSGDEDLNDHEQFMAATLLYGTPSFGIAHGIRVHNPRGVDIPSIGISEQSNRITEEDYHAIISALHN